MIYIPTRECRPNKLIGINTAIFFTDITYSFMGVMNYNIKRR